MALDASSLVELSVTTAVALIAAFMVVWLMARTDSSSPVWQQVLRAGVDGQVTPGAQATFHALEAFFVTLSLVLAFACAVMQSQGAAVLCALSLAILGRGAFDVPLRALWQRRSCGPLDGARRRRRAPHVALPFLDPARRVSPAAPLTSS